MLTKQCDYVNDVIYVVIKIDNPRALHVKTFSTILSVEVNTFGSTVSTKTNVLIKILLEH